MIHGYKINQIKSNQEIENVPVSNSMINRRIDDMPHGAEEFFVINRKITLSLSRLSQQISPIKVML
jgi:hypothetical protein